MSNTILKRRSAPSNLEGTHQQTLPRGLGLATIPYFPVFR